MSLSPELVRAFCSIDDPAVMEQFLSEIFTPAELEDFSLRWQLMRQLQEGKTQRAVAAELHISLCKITRGAKVLKNPDSVVRRLMQQQNDPPDSVQPPSQ